MKVRIIAAIVALLFGVGAAGAEEPARRMAVTVDDLPFLARGLDVAAMESATERMLAAFEAHGISTVAFVNEDKLLQRGEMDRRVAILERWLAAGHELGNHNFGHVGLTDTPVEAVEEAVVKGEVVTRWLSREHGRPLRYYRHPYTHTGPTAEIRARFERFLAERDYTIAPFTIENSDWLFNAVYVKALMRGDEPELKRIRDAYVGYTLAMTEFYESEARAIFGRDIAQIFLIHANAINADALPAILDALRARGYGFITLDAALRDEAYASRDGYIGRYGPSWVHRWRAGRGEDPRVSLRREPEPPAWVQEAP